MKLCNNNIKHILYEMSSKTSLFSVRPAEDFSRNRIFTFKTTILCILGMAGNSLNKELYDFFKDKPYSATASAFVQQRAKILPSAFEYLFHRFNETCTDKKVYKGYRLLAVDGSDLSYSKDISDIDCYTGQNCNQLHINALYDLLNRVYLDCVIQPKLKSNEPSACCEMINQQTFRKSILTADRGYGALNLIETVNRTDNLDYLFRVKNDWLNETKALPMGELDTEISFELRTTQTKEDMELYRLGKAKYISGISKFGKNKKSTTWTFETPCRMTMRIVRFKISDDAYETIATSLNRFEFPIDEIKRLYHFRWGIETSFRELKYALGLVNLHSKKRQFVEQEIWAKLIMYNYAERIINEVVVYQDHRRKWQYQVNFTMGFHICMDTFRALFWYGKSPPDINNLISRYILPIRPDRKDKRKLIPKGAVSFIYRVA